MALVFVALGEHDGMTVLQILKNVIALSSGMIKHIKFLDDGILLNGKRVTVRAVLREGDVLELNTSGGEEGSGIAPCELPLSVAYEDDDLVVPDKPPFMPTHPSHGHYDDTVANALAFRYRELDEPYVFRPVNRLDRNTSGLLIIARNRIAAGRLSDSMAKKKIRKEYVAVLDGCLESDAGVIETYMRRTRESIIVREVCEKEDGADLAITRYRVLAKNGRNTVVLAEPVTGRTHQLRVHFASLGCPIVGDDLYGAGSDDIARHALHAAHLVFPHPADGRTVELFSPLQEDMSRLIKTLFSDEDIENEIKKRLCEPNK